MRTVRHAKTMVTVKKSDTSSLDALRNQRAAKLAEGGRRLAASAATKRIHGSSLDATKQHKIRPNGIATQTAI